MNSVTKQLWQGKTFKKWCMIKRESKAQVLWGKCVRAMEIKGAFELKATKDTFNLYSFEPQTETQ